MLGFSTSFFILFEGQEEEDGNDSGVSSMNFPLSLLYTWSKMLTGFTITEITGSANTGVTALLFISFTYFINIVMLNLLIAIMGDIFDKIQENAKAEFMLARAQVVLEFEEVLRANGDMDAGNEVWFPTWLQVLVPTLEHKDESDWAGRLRALKASITKVEGKLEDSERKRVENAVRFEKELKRKLEESDRSRHLEIRHLEQSNERMEAMVKILLAKLEK